MKVELIEAKTAKALTENINRFLKHVNEEYHDDPYVEIFQPYDTATYTWRAFVIFKERKKE